jgi:hypothetical protein
MQEEEERAIARARKILAEDARDVRLLMIALLAVVVMACLLTAWIFW